MTMAAPLENVCCACLPADALAWLAPLRTHPGIRVRRVGERVWLWWTAGDEVVFRRVSAVRGAEMFARQEGRWHRPGQHLPAFNVPQDDEARPLLHVLTPDVVNPQGGEPVLAPLTIRLVREDRPRSATALFCPLADLVGWAEGATSRQLAALEAVYAGERVLLRGERLPPVTSGERYWGRRILTPLGFRPEPDLSEEILGEALRLEETEIALLGEAGFEPIEAGLFQPLTRAGVRLVVGERS
jgi:hypothetical protein